MAILVDGESRILVQGITGREASMVTRQALAYGTRILAGVTPGRGGQFVEHVPVYDSVRQACTNHDIDTMVVYVPPAFACDAVLEAVENDIPRIVIITERIPVQDTARFLTAAKKSGCTVIGPNSVGVITPGARIKVGAIGGDDPERCFVPGGVGIVSRSGGMTAECAWMVKRAGYGVSTCVSLGGDPFIGTSPAELLRMFETDVETTAVLLWGEPGTRYEEEAADLIAAGDFSKPLIAYIGGLFVEQMPEGTVFGHAASIIRGSFGRPSAKIKALQAAGALVPESFNGISDCLQEVMGK